MLNNDETDKLRLILINYCKKYNSCLELDYQGMSLIELFQKFLFSIFYSFIFDSELLVYVQSRIKKINKIVLYLDILKDKEFKKKIGKKNLKIFKKIYYCFYKELRDKISNNIYLSYNGKDFLFFTKKQYFVQFREDTDSNLLARDREREIIIYYTNHSRKTVDICKRFSKKEMIEYVKDFYSISNLNLLYLFDRNLNVYSSYYKANKYNYRRFTLLKKYLLVCVLNLYNVFSDTKNIDFILNSEYIFRIYISNKTLDYIIETIYNIDNEIKKILDVIRQ